MIHSGSLLSLVFRIFLLSNPKNCGLTTWSLYFNSTTAYLQNRGVEHRDVTQCWWFKAKRVAMCVVCGSLPACSLSKAVLLSCQAQPVAWCFTSVAWLFAALKLLADWARPSSHSFTPQQLVPRVSRKWPEVSGASQDPSPQKVHHPRPVTPKTLNLWNPLYTLTPKKPENH